MVEALQQAGGAQHRTNAYEEQVAMRQQHYEQPVCTTNRVGSVDAPLA